MRRGAPFLLGLVLLLCACAPLKPVEEPLRPVLTGHGIKATGTVEIKKGITLSGRAVLVVAAPDKFRIEVQGPFAQLAALIVSDGRDLYMLYAGVPRLYAWDDPFLPYLFTSTEVASILSGAALPYAACVGCEPCDGCTVRLDKSGRLAEFTKVRDDGRVLRISVADYRQIGEAFVPFDITIDDGPESIRVRYTDVEKDPHIDLDLFGPVDASQSMRQH